MPVHVSDASGLQHSLTLPGVRCTLHVASCEGGLIGSSWGHFQNYDKLPSYFIYAGLVFVNLMQPYLHEFGEDWYNQVSPLPSKPRGGLCNGLSRPGQRASVARPVAAG